MIENPFVKVYGIRYTFEVVRIYSSMLNMIKDNDLCIQYILNFYFTV